MQAKGQKKCRAFIFFLTTIFSLVLCSVFVMAKSNDAVIRNIMAYCTVTDSGERLQMIQVTVKDPHVLEYVEAEEFLVSGKAYAKTANQHNGFLSEETHDFTTAVKRIEKEGIFLKLYFSDLEENYYYIDKLLVVNKRDANLAFSLEDIDWVEVETADAFQTKVIENDSGLHELTYRIFEPKGEGSASPRPLVLSLHDTGDQENLLANRVVTSWAEEESQKEYPCYVLAPVFENQEEAAMKQTIGRTIKVIETMVAAGKVDPERIYMIGKGMGGSNAIKTAAAYQEVFAGILVLCPEIGNIQEEWYPALRRVPIYLIQAMDDPDSSIIKTRELYTGIKKAGSQSIKILEYSPERMLAGGVSAADHHHVDRIALSDWRFADWLFRQEKAGIQDAIQYIRAFTTVGAMGDTLTSLEITVQEKEVLGGLAADDFLLQAEAKNTALPSFQMGMKEIAVEGNTLQLIISDFPIGFHTVSAFQVICKKNPALSFSRENICDTVTETADTFDQYRSVRGAAFDYNIYGPNQIHKAIPLLVIFQDSNIKNPLLENDVVTKWADSRHQAANPAFILTPADPVSSQREQKQLEEQLVSLVKEWIQEGLVDAQSIYVMGEGTGKEYASHMAKAYPNLFSESPWK